MAKLGLCMVACVFLLGCQTDTGGLGTTDPNPGSGSSTSEVGGTASSGSGSGGVTSSGDTTASPSSSGSDTGPAEGTTAASSGPAPESSGGSEESGEPPPEGEPYGPCGAGATCNGVDVACYENGGFDMCLPPCDGGNPSCPPPPPDNGALVECIEVLGVHCMLNCAGGAMCPEGTVCQDLGGIFRCLWP